MHVKVAGEHELENAQIASIVDMTTDLNEEMLVGFYEDNREELRKIFSEKTIPSKLPFIEKWSASNENGWLHNGRLTWADLAFYLSVISMHGWMLPEVLQPYPGLQRLYASVESLPNITKWIKERPHND